MFVNKSVQCLRKIEFAMYFNDEKDTSSTTAVYLPYNVWKAMSSLLLG